MKRSPRYIEVIGADANNLQNVDIDIPLNAVTAVVGVSGSGKSSLIEDTIVVEAAERMRRFLDVDLGRVRGHSDAFIGVLPPTLFLAQRAFRASSRTTVSTSTGLLRVMRRLFVRFSQPVAGDVGEEVPPPSPEVFAAWLTRHVSGRAIVWAVPVLNQATTGETAVRRLVDAGLVEAVIRSETDRGAQAEKGRTVRLDHFQPLRPDVRHTIEVRVGEVQLGRTSRNDLKALLERAWSASGGRVFVELLDTDRPDLKAAFGFGLDARRHRVHQGSPFVYAPPDPHRLSFNAPEHLDSGACASCQGLGRAVELDESALIAHPERSMHEGAFALWSAKNYKYVNIQHATIEGLRGRDGFDPRKPWKSLPRSAQTLVLAGADEPVEDKDPKTGKKASLPHPFEGFRKAILARRAKATPAGEALRAFVSEGPCHDCDGTRWNRQARALRVAGWSIDRLLALPLSTLSTESRTGALARECPREARPLVGNLGRIAQALIDVGLGHLSGDRGMLDVSDGESRRVRLAGVLSSRLAGLLLVLDEPARGLHEQDLKSLGDTLVEAARLHTVLMSEHRARLVSRAHHLIELGPGAGPKGGQVTYSGPAAKSDWASERSPLRQLVDTPPVKPRHWLTISDLHIHNLTGVSIRVPLGAITCIAGVSGSGKSSFVRGGLVPALAQELAPDRVEIADFRIRAGRWHSLRGVEHVTALRALDQSPASAQRRSLVATFLDVAEPLRRLFAAEPVAKRLGLSTADFSTNGGKGRCQQCLGLGTFEDGELCPMCGGRRFGLDVLSVRVAGSTIADVLAEPVESLRRGLFPLPKAAAAILEAIDELGVGYLTLGRSLDTLSGGEIQRLRIARALTEPDASGTLFVLDEPAAGLHFRDVERLYRALRHIVSDGANTVVLVEHDPDLLAACDHIIEFGPEGGPDGGRVVATGSPSEVRDSDTPTGRALRSPRPTTRASTVVDGAQTRAADSQEVALRARAELRQILGDDVEIPDDDGDPVCPAALLDVSAGERRPLEIADLDASILGVLLDADRPHVESQLSHMAAIWAKEPDLHLQIHPLLHSLATWGPRIPKSNIAKTNHRLRAMGLGPPIDTGADMGGVRATGKRLAEVGAVPSDHLGMLREAWTLGGGFVELVDRKGRPRGVACDRRLDLAKGIVGPQRVTVSHLRRLDARGRCPMCHGRAAVTTVDMDLVVRRPSAPVLDESSLDPRAMAILRGVRRSEFVPFFRRFAEEGLWDEKATWSSLDVQDRATVLHGFWIRPGLGTFLKSGRSIDGSEVNHWLRWDGLVAALASQLERAHDARWREAVRASFRPIPCPLCLGSGLGSVARLFSFGRRSWAEWNSKGFLAEFLTTLDSIDGLPRRAVAARRRAASCLAALRVTNPPLRNVVSHPDSRPVLARAAGLFTGMPLITG